MKPRASASEAVPVKPFGTIIASRSTGIRNSVIVTIGTLRGCADFDADLSLCFGCESGETDSGNSS